MKMDCISPQLFANHSTYQNGLHPSSKVLESRARGGFPMHCRVSKRGIDRVSCNTTASSLCLLLLKPCPSMRGMMANMWRVSNHGVHTRAQIQTRAWSKVRSLDASQIGMIEDPFKALLVLQCTPLWPVRLNLSSQQAFESKTPKSSPDLGHNCKFVQHSFLSKALSSIYLNLCPLPDGS